MRSKRLVSSSATRPFRHSASPTKSPEIGMGDGFVVFRQKGAEYRLMVGHSRRRVADLSSGESIPFVTSTSLLAGDSSAVDPIDEVAVAARRRNTGRRLRLCAAGLL